MGGRAEGGERTIIAINAFDLIGLAILGVAAVGLVVLFLADRIAYVFEKIKQKKQQKNTDEAYVKMEEDYTE